MSYTIVRSDGNILTVIADNVIDTTSSPFSLPGRNFSGYGEPVDTNFIRSLENFANVGIPQNPIRGQLWYDISDPTNPFMRVCPQDGETDKSKWLTMVTTGPGGNLTLNPGNIAVAGNVDANNVNAANLVQGRLGYFYSIDDSLNTTSGALQVVGGVGIGKNAHIGGNLYVTGNGTISGNLSVEGDITYINVTTLAVEDPIISQGNGPNNTPLTANDGKDRGSALNYYDTAARIAFMGYDNSAAEFILGKDVTIAGEVVTVATYGNLRAGTVFANYVVPGANTQVLFNDLVGGLNVMNANASFTFDKTTGNLSANSIVSTIATGTPPFGVSSTTRVSGLFVQGANEANIQAVAAGTYYLNFSSATSGNRLLNANNAFYVDTATGQLTATTFNGNFLLPTGAAGNGSMLWNNNGNIADATGITTDNAGSMSLTGNVTATGNVDGGNINTGGVVIATGNVTGGNLNTNGIVAAVGNVTGGNLKTTGLVDAVGNVIGGNLVTTGVVQTPTLTTGAPATVGTLIGTWSLGVGSTLQATYADLAERHHSDNKYPIGTVMKVGGVNEVTQVDEVESTDVLGVVSNTAAYIMNSGAGDDDSHPIIGLIGRVKVRVIGSINKGDKITSAGNGCAMRMTMLHSSDSSFGWSLENNVNTEEKLILCVIK